LCRNVSGIISNFAASVQKSDYHGTRIDTVRRPPQQTERQRLNKCFASRPARLPNHD
jgi:hypothetical protein